MNKEQGFEGVMLGRKLGEKLFSKKTSSLGFSLTFSAELRSCPGCRPLSFILPIPYYLLN
jgi:hypothetical protein